MEPLNFTEHSMLQLPSGFRFHPTDEELIVHYLKPKAQSIPLPFNIPVADVNRSDPWTLPGDADHERYFFSTVETKYPCGKRSNRTALSGYWKTTGVDKKIVDSRNKHVVGTKKTLVFYRYKAPKGCKTNWVMHEYKLANSAAQGVKSWVICRVCLKKSGKKDFVKDEEMFELEKRGLVFYDFIGGPRKINDGSSSSCSSGITEDEGNSN
ncbi:hypothetical protein QVD17_03928 [Tagetes erecta]|uniref:NAC domain-containing protein n=1 Tax=Tagetes erecta TaxID=13708 RepID=A0AAD8L980_TARER|nr:hypothetical protein QVD17_03928 [Tagetes erecta]